MIWVFFCLLVCGYLFLQYEVEVEAGFDGYFQKEVFPVLEQDGYFLFQVFHALLALFAFGRGQGNDDEFLGVVLQGFF
jgi:hypothetical protein